MKKTMIGLLAFILVGVFMWAGIESGGGVIEQPAINMEISLFLSVVLLNIVAGSLTIITMILLLIGVELLFPSDSWASIISKIVIALGTFIPVIALTLYFLGKWIKFFPQYPTSTLWIVAVCIGVVSLIFSVYKGD